MKKLLVLFVTAMLLVIMIPAHAKEATTNIAATAVSDDKTEATEVSALVARVNEINAMDKSALSSTERKALRKELRTIKKHVNENSHHHGGVIYISGGVILLIILLIILL